MRAEALTLFVLFLVSTGDILDDILFATVEVFHPKSYGCRDSGLPGRLGTGTGGHSCETRGNIGNLSGRSLRRGLMLADAQEDKRILPPGNNIQCFWRKG